MIAEPNYIELFKLSRPVPNTEILNQLIVDLTIKSDTMVLDIGSGSGEDGLYVSKNTNSFVMGLDKNSYLINHAITKIPVLNFDVETDIIPLPSQAFHSIYAINFIHLIVKRKLLFQSIFSLLKFQGKFGLQLTTQDHIKSRFINEFFPSLATIELQRHPKIEDLCSELNLFFSQIVIKEIEISEQHVNNMFYNRLVLNSKSSLSLLNNSERETGLKKLHKLIQKKGDIKIKRKKTILIATK